LASIEVDARGSTVEALRNRLRAEGFIGRRTLTEVGVFTEGLRRAVQAFQYSRGLPTTGVFNETCARAANVPARHLIQRIRKALRKWRRSQTRNETDFIQVNLPEYVVELYQNQLRARRHKAVIGYAFGSGGGRTKQFHSEVNEIMLNPSWMPSDGILKNELLSKERAEPGYLEDNGFQWTTRKNGTRAVFQSPGPGNALGRALLRFPNKNNIYLHGSPDQTQFTQARRAMSHGCVRVQDIEGLAIHLAESDGVMDGASIWEQIESRQPRRVKLRRPIAIHFEYVLTVVDDSGFVRFLPNVYKR
jgi:murein L,D-transpeptidase YcbB/YkuD